MASKRQRARRPRVLLSAFACEPGRGSEQEVGWRWALEMSRWFDVTVVTQTRNRAGIEREVDKGLPDECQLCFQYVQLPEFFYCLKSRFDPLTWPYYALWQMTMMRAVKRLHARDPFVLAHHVTFVSFRVPIWLKILKVPVVFGPVGGADLAPFNLLRRGFGLKFGMKEIGRNIATRWGAVLMRLFPPLGADGGVCLAATPAMAEIFERLRLPYELFPAIGVDIDAATQPRPTTDRAHQFLFVGRFHPLKGAHLLIEAFAKADISDATLTLIGSGHDESRLRAMADKYGIAGQLTWIGKLPREDLMQRYRDYDVLVVPSLYESGGLVALEAMSAGIPVIALDVGGHSLSIVEGCGIKISATGTIDQVVERIADAMKTFYLRNRESVNDEAQVLRRAVVAYSWPHKANYMRIIYNSLICQS